MGGRKDLGYRRLASHGTPPVSPHLRERVAICESPSVVGLVLGVGSRGEQVRGPEETKKGHEAV